MSYIYQSFEPGLWTVGFYKPDGKFEPESDHRSSEEAAGRVTQLNGDGQSDPRLHALLAALTNLTTAWLTAAGSHQARADRLGNCAAGKEAFGDALALRNCTSQLFDAINDAIT